MSEKLELRVYGSPAQPTLVYLPGLHGDWTLVGRFRRALGKRVRFVEMTYPRTLTWSLADYAAGIEQGLAEAGIDRGWLLGESFGSQIAWPLLQRGHFQVAGIILAGGFVSHPSRWGVRLAQRLCGGVSLSLLTRVLFGYARLRGLRYRNEPEVTETIRAFMARRTELDRQAAQHRLRLIAQNDPCAIARASSVPVYALTGAWDVVVPWLWVRRWLARNCPALRAYRVLRGADHTVLISGAPTAAELVLEWMTAAAR